MAKYLWQANYVGEGLKGLLKALVETGKLHYSSLTTSLRKSPTGNF